MRPILYEIGPIPLRSYGVMMMVGFLAGLYWAVRTARKRGVDPNLLVDICIYALLSGVIGSRIVYVFLNWGEFQGNWGELLSVWQGGLSFHGGLLFAVAIVYLYTLVKRVSFLQIADLLAPSLALAYAFTRIGCFLNGCCYGVETHVPWAVTFPDLLAPVHPTQLYAAVANFLIFFLLVRVQTWEMPKGYTFAAYIALYSVYRFVVEIWRKGATASVLVDGLTEAQVVSLVMLLGASVVLWKLRGQAKQV